MYFSSSRAVAILCNHHRAVPKSHDKGMEKLNERMKEKKEKIAEAEKEFKAVKKAYKKGELSKDKYEKKKTIVARLYEQLSKIEADTISKEENKTVAMGTSKLNYLDPRITVAWCKKFEVPIEKVFTKTHREKFRWAIDMAEADYVF